MTATATTSVPSLHAFDRRARAQQPLNVVFLGGSLTWGANASDPQLTSYRALMGRYLQDKHPTCPMHIHDAAIGGTGSDLGMFRLERDVLSHEPDLVFLDFTVNDGFTEDSPYRLRTYEYIVRQLAQRGIPVVQVFTALADAIEPDRNLDDFKRYHAHRALGEAYGLVQGDTIAYLHDRVVAGDATIDAMYPLERTHPIDLGYRYYFEAVRDAYEAALTQPEAYKLPETPIYDQAITQVSRQSLAGLPHPAAWKPQLASRVAMWFDGMPSRWMDGVLECELTADTPPEDAVLTLPFVGTSVSLFGERNGDSAPFRVKIDGKPALPQGQSAAEDAPDAWDISTANIGGGNLFAWTPLAAGLTQGHHTLTLEPILPAGMQQGRLRLADLCVATEG